MPLAATAPLANLNLFSFEFSFNISLSFCFCLAFRFLAPVLQVSCISAEPDEVTDADAGDAMAASSRAAVIS